MMILVIILLVGVCTLVGFIVGVYLSSSQKLDRDSYDRQRWEEDEF